MIRIGPVRVKPFRQIRSSTTSARFGYFFRFGKLNTCLRGNGPARCRGRRPRNDLFKQVIFVIIDVDGVVVVVSVRAVAVELVMVVVQAADA